MEEEYVNIRITTTDKRIMDKIGYKSETFAELQNRILKGYLKEEYEKLKE